MKLKDMYGQYVANFGPVLDVKITPDLSFASERDPSSILRERAVNTAMSNAVSKATQHFVLPTPANKIKVVSYEEAIRQLASTFKTADNKA